jgi:hypothetical protein
MNRRDASLKLEEERRIKFLDSFGTFARYITRRSR